MTPDTDTPGLDLRGLRKRMEYMRGIAILSVVFGHFAGDYTTLPFPLFQGYFIAFFFLISGYGIEHSLTSRLQALGTWRGLASFYAKRALRLYPVFWSFLALDALFGSDPTGFDLGEVLLVQFQDPQRKWFLHAIVLCYLCAPLLHLAVKSAGKRAPALLTALLLTAVALLVGFDLPRGQSWDYLFLPFGNIYLFAMGMAAAPLLPGLRLPRSNAALTAMTVSMLALFAITAAMRIPGLPPLELFLLPPGWNLLLPALLYASILGFALLFFLHARKLPAERLLRFAGGISLSLYVFEGAYLTLLKKLHLIHGTSAWNALAYLALLPLFLSGCWVLERWILSGALLRSFGKQG